jgi:hypothetical protein
MCPYSSAAAITTDLLAVMSCSAAARCHLFKPAEVLTVEAAAATCVGQKHVLGIEFGVAAVCWVMHSQRQHGNCHHTR